MIIVLQHVNWEWFSRYTLDRLNEAIDIEKKAYHYLFFWKLEAISFSSILSILEKPNVEYSICYEMIFCEGNQWIQFLDSKLNRIPHKSHQILKTFKSDKESLGKVKDKNQGLWKFIAKHYGLEYQIGLCGMCWVCMYLYGLHKVRIHDLYKMW